VRTQHLIPTLTPIKQYANYREKTEHSSQNYVKSGFIINDVPMAKITYAEEG